MQYITEFFNKIGVIIESLISFVKNFFLGCVDFFSDLSGHVDNIQEVITLLPAQIVYLALLVVSAQLIFIIIGRRGH